MAVAVDRRTGQIADSVVDREQLKLTQELFHVKASAERPPLDEYFNGENILEKKYNASLMNTIGHELNHLMVAYKLGVPLDKTTLTAVPKGDILGQVTLPDHVDYATLQIIATAGSVPTHDGSARGYGSDIYKAQLIEMFGMGTSVAEAQRKAAAIINFYSSDVREISAKIIAYLQIEKGMSHIPGELLVDIEARAHYELKKKKSQIKSPPFFKPLPVEETVNQKMQEATVGRPPDRRTVLEWVGEHVLRVKYLTDDVVESTVNFCGVCKSINGHRDECEVLQKDFNPEKMDRTFTHTIINRYRPAEHKPITQDLPLLDSTDQKYQN